MRHVMVGIALLALLALPASAGVGLVETNTKTKGATTITWDSSFADSAYSIGTTATFTVNWTVDAGAAAYYDVALRRFTPRSRRDPADGVLDAVSPGTDSVTVDAIFTDLHFDRRRNVDIGTGHFKLYLMVDKNGDGTLESLAGFGVNLHVED